MRRVYLWILVLLSLGIIGCDASKKSEMAGRWVTKETVVDKGFPAKTYIVVRSLSLDASGRGEFTVSANDELTRKDTGNWSVVSDVFILDYEGGKANYFRILRLTKERLVIRTEEGVERIYDRIQ